MNKNYDIYIYIYFVKEAMSVNYICLEGNSLARSKRVQLYINAIYTYNLVCRVPFAQFYVYIVVYIFTYTADTYTMFFTYVHIYICCMYINIYLSWQCIYIFYSCSKEKKYIRLSISFLQLFQLCMCRS